MKRGATTKAKAATEDAAKRSGGGPRGTQSAGMFFPTAVVFSTCQPAESKQVKVRSVVKLAR